MTRQEIDRITRRLVDYFHPERIHLFGSVARGDDGPDTDMDFGVVLFDGAPVDGAPDDALAPIPAVRGTATEPLESSLSGPVTFRD